LNTSEFDVFEESTWSSLAFAFGTNAEIVFVGAFEAGSTPKNIKTFTG